MNDVNLYPLRPCRRGYSCLLLEYTLTCMELGIDHGICELTNGGNWDIRQNVRMEAIGNSAFGNKRGGISC